MNRREFIGTAGAALMVGRVSPPQRLERIGLELYSVRDAMKADPEGTLTKVRAMGYTDVELLWTFNHFGLTIQQTRTILDREGLEAPSAHIAPEALTKDWQKSLDEARFLGHQYLIVPSLPAETNTSLDAWRRWAATFNNAGQHARKSGVWLAFHNEPSHHKAIGGVVPYDLFLRFTDPSVVRFQLDVGNMVMGGAQPARYIAQHGERYFSFHIKDIPTGRGSDTELGKGTIDFKRLLGAIKDVQHKPCYVEQENSPSPMDAAARNFLYLKGLDF
jgi:sugar phosphate isomerase/epimerase